MTTFSFNRRFFQLSKDDQYKALYATLDELEASADIKDNERAMRIRNKAKIYGFGALTKTMIGGKWVPKYKVRYIIKSNGVQIGEQYMTAEEARSSSILKLEMGIFPIEITIEPQQGKKWIIPSIGSTGE